MKIENLKMRAKKEAEPKTQRKASDSASVRGIKLLKPASVLLHECRVRHREKNYSLDEAYEGGNIGPAEQKIENTLSCLTEIELMYSDTSEYQREYSRDELALDGQIRINGSLLGLTLRSEAAKRLRIYRRGRGLRLMGLINNGAAVLAGILVGVNSGATVGAKISHNTHLNRFFPIF